MNEKLRFYCFRETDTGNPRKPKSEKGELYDDNKKSPSICKER